MSRLKYKNINLFFDSRFITVNLFNFASGLFSRYSRGRYFRENKSLRKFNYSVIANEISQRNAKINRRQLTFHRQNAKNNSLENKKVYNAITQNICFVKGSHKHDVYLCDKNKAQLTK